MVDFMQCEKIYDESCWRWLIVLIITHGCSAIIFIAVVVISKNTLQKDSGIATNVPSFSLAFGDSTTTFGAVPSKARVLSLLERL